MDIVKVLNNNMVLIRTEKNQEEICQGKGIGFGKKAGSPLDESLVERRFVLKGKEERKQFTNLFSEISDEYFAIASKVLDYARTKQHLNVKDKVLLPLCDHMAGSVDRYKKGVALNNPMLWDIKRIYPAEFAVGLYALELIEQELGIQMKEDEAGFIAYHFVSAELENASDVAPNEATRFISDIVGIVEASFQITLEESDWDYQRFLTHLKFFANRVLSKTVKDELGDTDLYDDLSERYKHINNCVNRIADYILIEHHYDINTDERLYLLIHIQRVTKRFLRK